MNLFLFSVTDGCYFKYYVNGVGNDKTKMNNNNNNFKITGDKTTK